MLLLVILGFVFKFGYFGVWCDLIVRFVLIGFLVGSLICWLFYDDVFCNCLICLLIVVAAFGDFCLACFGCSGLCLFACLF